MFRNNVRIDDDLLRRAQECAAREGYASAEEFIAHALEKEIARLTAGPQDNEKSAGKAVGDRLRGLGYIE